MWRLKLATLNRNDGRALKMLLIVAWKATIIALCPFLFELNILFCDRPLWKSRAYNTKNSTPEICVFQLRRTNDAISLRQTNYILFLLLYSCLMFGQNRSVKSWKEWNCCAMRRMVKKNERSNPKINSIWLNELELMVFFYCLMHSTRTMASEGCHYNTRRKKTILYAAFASCFVHSHSHQLTRRFFFLFPFSRGNMEME